MIPLADDDSIRDVLHARFSYGGVEQTDLEEFSQGFVIHSIGAIEDDTLFGNGFGQIFGCFSLQIHNERFLCD
jgi:hypothetical protein